MDLELRKVSQLDKQSSSDGSEFILFLNVGVKVRASFLSERVLPAFEMRVR